MAISVQNVRIVSLLVSALITCGSVHSQTFENGYYRLTNKWLGDGKSLDVVNDGTNSKIQLAESKRVTGQAWKLTPVGDGYYRLTTEWLGAERSLNVINDHTDSKLSLAQSSDVTGQYWKLTPIGGGYYRLTTKWFGDERALDVINDDKRNKLQLAETSEVEGQYWKLTSMSGKSGPGSIETSIRPLNEFNKMTFAGFTVNVHPELVGKDVTNKALTLLNADLTKIAKLIKPEHVSRLRKVPIWIQYKLDKSGMWYHESKGWLVPNGYPAELEKSVEISDINSFVEEHDRQPFATLHELAHAYNDLYLSAMRIKLKAAYDNAVKSGKYDKVERIGSGVERHYALTNEKEYFAELTEAYFGKNDYFPFTRAELVEFDPQGFELIQEAWQ